MGPASAISLTVVLDRDGVCVFAEGPVDSGTAATFSDRLGGVIALARSPIAVDLSRVSFADVDGYRAMARFGEHCARHGLDNFWVCPSPSVELLWRILGEPGGTVHRTRWNDVATVACTN